MARVTITARAARELDDLPLAVRGRVLAIMERLETWSAVSGAKPLRGGLAGRYRVRTGDYRGAVPLAGDQVVIERVGHRDGFYEDAWHAKANVVRLDGREYVILARDEYDRLAKLAKVAEMPALPEADADGSFPAVEYARASIARDLVRQRVERGLSQRDLARLAKVRVETLCRIETGKHTASTATLAKLDRALRHARKNAKATKRAPRRRRSA